MGENKGLYKVIKKKKQWICYRCGHVFFNKVTGHKVSVKNVNQKADIAYLYITVECPKCQQVNHCISRPYLDIMSKGSIDKKGVSDIDTKISLE